MTRDENPLDYVAVSEGQCQRRTKEIKDLVSGVSTQVSGLDKKLDVHLAGIKGAQSQGQRMQASIGTIIAIIMVLIALGGIVYGAAKLSQPDIKAIAAELRGE